jgi:hypothetical protein
LFLAIGQLGRLFGLTGNLFGPAFGEPEFNATLLSSLDAVPALGNAFAIPCLPAWVRIHGCNFHVSQVLPPAHTYEA